MARLALASLFVLLIAFPLNIAAQDELCAEDYPDEDIESGEEIEFELDAGESIYYFHESETNAVWRIDMDASDTLVVNFYDPDNNGDLFFDFSVQEESLSTAVRTTQAGEHCIEVRNNSDNSIDYELTFTLLEPVNGLLQDVEGLDAYGNNVVGVYYHTIGEFELAVEFFEIAIEENPDDPRFWNNNCIALRDLREYEEALDYCLEALDMDSETIYYFYDTGVIYKALGDYETAEGYLEDAVNQDPSNIDYLSALAVNDVFLGDAEEAIEHFDDYVDHADLWFETYWRGLAYLNAGDYENAINDLQEAIDAEEAEPALYHLWLGIAQLADGDEDAAEDAFETAEDRLDTDSDTDELTILRTQAFYAVFLGDNDDAEDYYEDAIEIGTVFSNRGDLFYLTVLSNTFPEEESYAEALDMLREELGID